MLVNRELNMVFLHAPKCAGITLTHWLVDHYGFSDHSQPDVKCPGSGVVERHRYQLPADCQGCQVITCIREPFQRWKSFYLYCTLEMGVSLSFEQFTRERIKWLPLQVEYTRHADFVLRVDQLAAEVRRLPFVVDPVPPLPRRNASQDKPGYEAARRSVEWTGGIVHRIREHFAPDFELFE